MDQPLVPWQPQADDLKTLQVAQELLDKSSTTKIVDQGSYDRSTSDLKHVTANIGTVKEMLDRVLGPHKDFISSVKAIVDPKLKALESAQKNLKDIGLEWLHEQEAKRLEEKAKLEAAKAERDAEILKRAKTEEKKGNIGTAEDLRAFVAEHQDIPAPPPTFHRQDGANEAKIWTFRLKPPFADATVPEAQRPKLLAQLKEIEAKLGLIPREYLEPERSDAEKDWSRHQAFKTRMNGLARANHDAIKVAGIEFYQKSVLRVSAFK